MEFEERRNYTYLKSLFDSLHSEAVDYVNGGETPEERYDRIKEIRNKLITVDEPVTIAAGFDNDPYGCPPGKHCVGGACVDDLLELHWPPEGDPTTWNDGMA
jgi:hypothetical protein